MTHNQPMSQFEVFRYNGRTVLTVVDMTRYDFWIGFRRVVAVLEG